MDLKGDTRRWVVWATVATTAKVLLFASFVHFFTRGPREIPVFWGVPANDTLSYTEPVDASLESGTLRPLFSAYRMPGYGLPYLCFRVFLSKGAALNGMLIVQLLAAAASMTLLLELAYRLNGSLGAPAVAFGLYLLLPILSFYDIVALTESLSASLLVAALYLVLTRRPGRSLLLAGSCLAWAVFLRPVFLPIVFLFAVYVAAAREGSRFRTGLVSALVLVAPLAAADFTWAVGRAASGAREHLFMPDPFHPLYRDDSKHTLALVGLLKALGDDWTHAPWPYSPHEPAPCAIETSRFNCTSLDLVRQRVLRTQTDIVTLRKDRPPAQVIEENRELSRDLRAYRDAVVAERPLHYAFVAPARYLSRLVARSSTGRMFGQYSTMNPKWRPARLVLDAVWWAMEAGLLVVLLVRVSRLRANRPLTLTSIVVVYFYLVHAVVFRTDDFRYLVPILPLCVLVLASAVVAVLPCELRGASSSNHSGMSRPPGAPA